MVQAESENAVVMGTWLCSVICRTLGTGTVLKHKHTEKPFCVSPMNGAHIEGLLYICSVKVCNPGLLFRSFPQVGFFW